MGALCIQHQFQPRLIQAASGSWGYMMPKNDSPKVAHQNKSCIGQQISFEVGGRVWSASRVTSHSPPPSTILTYSPLWECSWCPQSKLDYYGHQKVWYIQEKLVNRTYKIIIIKLNIYKKIIIKLNISLLIKIDFKLYIFWLVLKTLSTNHHDFNKNVLCKLHNTKILFEM